MTVEEFHAHIREQMREQPRGYQAQLAAQLGISRQYINAVLAGRRPIPPEHLQGILDSLGLEIEAKKKAG